MGDPGIQHDQLLRRDVRAIQLRGAFEHVQRALRMAGLQRDLRIGIEIDCHVQGVGEHTHR